MCVNGDIKYSNDNIINSVLTSAAVPSSEGSVGAVTLVVGVPLNTDTLVKARAAGTFGLASGRHSVGDFPSLYHTSQVHRLTVNH